MIKLMCGNNWDEELLDGYIELNKKYEHNGVVINEMYGSLVDNPLGTARPDYRIQDKSFVMFERFVDKANRFGIKINYTLNTSCIGSLEEFAKKEHSIIRFLQHLESTGVHRVTVAHPLIIELVNQHTGLSVELSTIFEIDSTAALKGFAGKIDKVCIKLAKNRDFMFLKAMKMEADKHNIHLELLANEFCYIYCIDRAACYNLHGHTKTKTTLYNNYPMGRCILKRYQEPVEWIKAPFILPQWMSWYADNNNVGIRHFKITGRTHPTPYLLWVVEQYMQRSYRGNLLKLWANLECIGKEHSDWPALSYELNIQESLLVSPYEFLDVLETKNVDCSIDCEHFCKVCYGVLEEIQEIAKKKN